MTGNKAMKKFLPALTAATGIAAVLYILWLNGAFLPRWIVWENRSFPDKTGAYEITLKNKTVKISSGSADIWKSPKGIKIQDALSCDIDNDQQEELVLLCWKRGRYGRHKPFWVERDEQGWSQHIFVYEYDRETIKPKWMSSYIGQEVASITVSTAAKSCDSAGGNGRNSNAVLLTDLEGVVSRWQWDSWGFTKQETEVSFAVFGDNLIHEPIYRYGLQKDAAFSFLFAQVRDMISVSDVAVINQETPLVDNPSLYSSYPRFGTPLPVGQAIVDAGFDVVTCATNHALDKGTQGIETTKNFFEANHLICLGIQREEETKAQPYEIIVKNGIRFALLNYTYGTNGIPLPEDNPNMVHVLQDEDKIKNDLSRAKSEADMVIVFVHWGTENTEQVDAFQQRWAQVFLESKVDIVVGTHPHVLQPYEVLMDAQGHEMLIYYSIGNFISAQPEKSCVKGGMASFTVSQTTAGYRVTEYALQPLTITWQEGGRYTVQVLL